MRDEFGLPERLFGELPDWFFPAVGRVVAVSSLLENKAQALTEALVGVPHESMTSFKHADMRARSLKASRDIDAANSGDGIESIGPSVKSFFDRATSLLERRNAIVHAVWPAQQGDEQFGWRPRRLGKDAATRVTRDNSRTLMTDLITDASDLVLAFNDLLGRTSYARVRAGNLGGLSNAMSSDVGS